jgi:hypothetical protein
VTKTKDVVSELAHREEDGEGYRRLSTGHWAKLVPVGATLIEEASRSVEDPPVPVIHDEAQGDIENPMDPAYLREVARAQRKRVTVATDTMIMFGVELRDGVPDEAEWLKKLQWMEKRGAIDLSGYDLDDPLDMELVFKKYIAVATEDLIRLGNMAGLRQKDVEDAMKSFPGK